MLECLRRQKKEGITSVPSKKEHKSKRRKETLRLAIVRPDENFCWRTISIHRECAIKGCRDDQSIESNSIPRLTTFHQEEEVEEIFEHACNFLVFSSLDRNCFTMFSFYRKWRQCGGHSPSINDVILTSLNPWSARLPVLASEVHSGLFLCCLAEGKSQSFTRLVTLDVVVVAHQFPIRLSIQFTVNIHEIESQSEILVP